MDYSQRSPSSDDVLRGAICPFQARQWMRRGQTVAPIKTRPILTTTDLSVSFHPAPLFCLFVRGGYGGYSKDGVPFVCPIQVCGSIRPGGKADRKIVIRSTLDYPHTSAPFHFTARGRLSPDLFGNYKNRKHLIHHWLQVYKNYVQRNVCRWYYLLEKTFPIDITRFLSTHTEKKWNDLLTLEMFYSAAAWVIWTLQPTA